jgi:hypothetical protein
MGGINLDKFHEQLLRTTKSNIYKLFVFDMYFSVVLAVFTAIIASLTLSIGSIFFTIIFIGSALVARYFRDKQYKEFEYVFTNGNIQIDVIFNKKKRKTLFDVDIKELDSFGKSKELKFDNSVKKINCFPWNNKDEKYVLLINGRQKQAVYIAPNEELLKLINIYNIRRPRG